MKVFVKSPKMLVFVDRILTYELYKVEKQKLYPRMRIQILFPNLPSLSIYNTSRSHLFSAYYMPDIILEILAYLFSPIDLNDRD